MKKRPGPKKVEPPKKKWPKKIHRGNFTVQDKWFEKAKQDGYRARSAYKLLQIDEHFHLIQPGMRILDIASAPWSWLQVISRTLGSDGLVIGFDLQPIKSLKKPNVRTFVWDIFEYEEVSEKIEKILNSDFWILDWDWKFDLITSDIAPKTTGHKGVDQYASIELNLAILDLANKLLKPGWSLVMKVFLGEDVQDLIWPVKQHFEKLHRFNPPAVRRRSFEEYFVCLGKK